MVSRFVILTLLVLGALGDYCGNNCPSGNCPACPCGEEKQSVNIAQWCMQGPWDQTCCQKIVAAESEGNANAMGFDGSFDVGLWQINSWNWMACNLGHPPCDLQDNLRCAILIWQWGGNSFKYWTTASWFPGC